MKNVGITDAEGMACIIIIRAGNHALHDLAPETEVAGKFYSLYNIERL